MNLDFIKKYIVLNESDSSNENYKKLKHHLFRLKRNEINGVNDEIKIPLELDFFFKEVGYGFFSTK